MFVSYRWLQEYVDISDISAEELAEKITRSGIEVEGVEELNNGITGVVVGHILKCEQHPNADKLRICQVDIGEEEAKQIICGAPNVAKGQKVIVAKVGAVLPGNFKIKKAKLRGEVSEGMICSLQELGVESKFVPKEHAEGIFVFPNDVEPGSDALEFLNMNDKVLELGLTPNRADCLNMIGVAYEVAAILGRSVRLPKPNVTESAEKAADYIKVAVENKEDSPYYGARVIKNVKIGPSPLWMQTRLMAAGIRPINNVVDITNYILLEYGQPLHAFDYDKLGSTEILVRRAKEGETIKTLDGQERTLAADHLVITNGKEPVALAGVMGGADSEIGDDTVNVLLESAVFHPALIRKTSKDHGLRSEASARFEKGIDPLRAPEAANRAAELIALYANGEVLQGIVESNKAEAAETSVSVTIDNVNKVLGTEISEAEIAAIFTRLQFSFTVDNGAFYVNVPSRRGDIAIPEDLIEEVARLYGYDNLPSTLPVGEATPGQLTSVQTTRRKIRRYLEGAGLYQAVTYSLTSEEKVKRFILSEYETAKPIKLSMPMSEERSALRLSIIPHLLEALRHNKARQIDDVAIYELANIYVTNNETLASLPEEREHLAGAITGLWRNHPWQKENKQVDFYVAKGVLEGLFMELGVAREITYVQAEREGLHPGRTANILLNGAPIGFIGQLHPEEQKQFDLEETYVFEFSLQQLLENEAEPVTYTQIPRYPSTTRDIALVVDENVTAGEIEQVIKEAGGELLRDVVAFDVYQGEHLEQGKKSVAFSLRYMDPNRTLTDDEVVKVHDNVLKALEQKVSAKLRG